MIGFGKSAMGMAIPPFFVILRNLNHPMTEQWLNHENIHLRQFIESLGIFWIYSKIEYLYYRVVKKLTHIEAYRKEAIEQEAYLNQHNLKYLSSRKVFSTIKYAFNKADFYTDENHKVIIISSSLPQDHNTHKNNA